MQQEVRVGHVHASVNNPVWRCVCGAGVSSFLVFVPSKSLSLGGPNRGQVVAVLVLGPEAEPLLVGFLFLLFGSLPLPRTPCSKTGEREKARQHTV